MSALGGAAGAGFRRGTTKSTLTVGRHQAAPLRIIWLRVLREGPKKLALQEY